ISDRIAYFPDLASEIIPIAIPVTGDLIGIPASINANDPAHTVAMDEEPFDSKMSDTIRIVYGFSSGEGSTFFKALIARLPWPTSLLPGPLFGFTSPVENPGKL